MPANRRTNLPMKIANFKDSDMDALLQQSIGIVSSVSDSYAHALVDANIISKVRITNNKKRLGSCRIVQQGGHKSYQISISRKTFELPGLAVSTMIHEVIHTLPGCMNHGNKFKRAADLVNVRYGEMLNVKVSTRCDILDFADDGLTSEERAKLQKQWTKEARSKVNEHIGETFKLNGYTAHLDGFNPRARRFDCMLTDVSGRRQLKATSGLVAETLGLIEPFEKWLEKRMQASQEK